MPYCTQCGKQVTETAAFCAGCGSRQSGGIMNDPLGRITPRTAALLCYIPVLGWIAAIVVLAADRFRHDRQLRFHAFQGLYLFVAWLIADWVLSPMLSFAHAPFRLGGLIKAVIFAAWIFMIVKVSQNQSFRLPVLGELAERSVSEQR